MTELVTKAKDPAKLAAFVAWTSLAAIAMWGGLRLDFGSFSEPGPGLFPVLLSAIVVVLTLIDLIVADNDSSRTQTDADAAQTRGLRARRSLVIVCVIAFAVLLPYLGSILVAALMMMFLLVIVEKQPIVMSLTVSLYTSIGMYVVLAAAFGVPLPSGILEYLLFEA